MNYTISLLFLYLSLINVTYSAEDNFLINLKINELSILEKEDLYKFLYLQREALVFAHQKKELEATLTVELYQQQKIETQELENKYYQAKKVGNKLYYTLSPKTRNIIDKIMSDCMMPGTGNLCMKKVLAILNYIMNT